MINCIDADSIYRIPRMLHAQGLDDLVVERFGLEAAESDLSEWDAVVDGLDNADRSVRIAMVGKYVELAESYKSLSEALVHAGIHTGTRVEIRYVDSEEIESAGPGRLEGADAVLVPGGFGKRGIEGKIRAVRYARENGVPYLGICLGMHVAVIEYARHCAGLEGADSTEFNPGDAVPGHRPGHRVDREGRGDSSVGTKSRTSGSTMRLGAQESGYGASRGCARCTAPTSSASGIGIATSSTTPTWDPLQDAGLRIAGKTLDGTLVEVVEVPGHPWFIACQFHPEFTSTPRDGHPLFRRFVEVANDYRERIGGGAAENDGASGDRTGRSIRRNTVEKVNDGSTGEGAGEDGLGRAAPAGVPVSSKGPPPHDPARRSDRCRTGPSPGALAASRFGIFRKPW